MKTARSTVDAVTSVAASMQPTRISGVQESTGARNFIFSHTHTHTHTIKHILTECFVENQLFHY